MSKPPKKIEADQQAPTVGRIVHLHRLADSMATGPHAAIVTQVRDDGTVDLHVFPPAQTPHAVHAVGQGVPKKMGLEAAWWEWPSRAELVEVKPAEAEKPANTRLHNATDAASASNPADSA